MTSSLREALDAEARGIPAFGDIDAALEQVGRSQRRRRAVVAAVSGLAAAAALVWAVGLGSRSTDGAPIAPAPSGAPVVTLEQSPPDLTSAPLAAGADAVVREGRTGLTAVSGTQQRGNLIGNSFRLYGVALSPDGRYLAWSGSGGDDGSGADQLHITDLTSATEVVTEPIVTATGGGGQTPHMEWSGDSRSLAMVVLETARMEAKPSGELQLLDVGADARVEKRAAPIDLPGPFVGLDRTGTTLLAESSTGTILTRRAAAGAWTATGAAAWPAGLDSQAQHTAYRMSQGVHRLSPDGRRVAWVHVRRGDEQGSGTTVGWVSRATGEWTMWTVEGADASCLGWRGADLLLAVRRTSTTDVVAVDPAGAQRVLVTYAQSELAARTLGAPEVLVALDRLRS